MDENHVKQVLNPRINIKKLMGRLPEFGYKFPLISKEITTPASLLDTPLTPHKIYFRYTHLHT